VNLGIVFRTATATVTRATRIQSVKCRHCGDSFLETHEDCPHCGSFHHLQTVCGNCGFRSVRRQYNLCPQCGAILLEGRPIARWLLIQIPVTAMFAIVLYIQPEFGLRAMLFVLMWLSLSVFTTWSIISGTRLDKRNKKWTDRLERKRIRKAKQDKGMRGG
jgi:ribosomal protein S27AE